MDNARKMVMMPAEAESAIISQSVPLNPIEKEKEKKPSDKLSKVVTIALKLAKINAFDHDGRIRDRDGKLIANSDMSILLQHAMKNGKVLIGEDEFIHLLYQAQVPSELIFNNNIKSKLESLIKTQQIRREIQPVVYDRVQEPVEEPVREAPPPRRSVKRKAIEEPISSKLPRWEIPD